MSELFEALGRAPRKGSQGARKRPEDPVAVAMRVHKNGRGLLAGAAVKATASPASALRNGSLNGAVQAAERGQRLATYGNHPATGSTAPVPTSPTTAGASGGLWPFAEDTPRIGQWPPSADRTNGALLASRQRTAGQGELYTQQRPPQQTSAEDFEDLGGALPARPTTPGPGWSSQRPRDAAAAADPVDWADSIPPRPMTPCMNRGGDGAKKGRRQGSASRGRGARPSSGSVGARISQLETALLARRQNAVAGQPGPAAAGLLAGSQPSAVATGALARAPLHLLQEAIAMCRDVRGSNEAPAAASPFERPPAPTPEQTNHWLRDFEQRPLSAARLPPTAPPMLPQGQTVPVRSPSPEDSPMRGDRGMGRPRSPTPTKMLAWEEEEAAATPGTSQGGAMFSPDSADLEGRGDQTDSLISRLIGACQVNDVGKAFLLYEKLRMMRVTLYEGVYKLLIECCMRTQQLGHAMHFYETLRVSGQRVSHRLVIVLMEACAREQHGEKVFHLWSDWCNAHQPAALEYAEVLLVALSALIRTMSPDLALRILSEEVQRSAARVASALKEAIPEIEELMQLAEAAAVEMQHAGDQIGGCLAQGFLELLDSLENLRQACHQERELRHAEQPEVADASNTCRRGWASSDVILFEDVDLDLELAAM